MNNVTPVQSALKEEPLPLTHSIDPRQLLGELQKDGDDDGLAVERGAKELQDGHAPLHVHLPLLLLHLRQHVAHLLPAGQPPQACKKEV